MDRGEPREIELKYRLDDAALVRELLERPRIGAFEAEPGVETLETHDRFLDTPRRAFAALEQAVRLRTAGGGTVVTVKGPSIDGPGGSTSRVELEATAEGDDPRRWPASPARQRVLTIAADEPLVEVARLRQRRRRRLLRSDDAAAELSVDDVEVLDGDRVVDRWVELEIELREGEAGVLAVLARELESVGGLTRATESKYAAALRALAAPESRIDQRR